MKRIIGIVLVLWLILPAKAQNSEDLHFSLLTVKPRSNEVYTLFGHTALRMHDSAENLDVVFNWGTFSFDEPNFIFRFLKGETDYFLSLSDYDSFCSSYEYSQSTVIEQELNLTSEQKTELFSLLDENYRTENREYRYNFLFDNCTTRVRDLIEIVCKDNLQYPAQGEKTTLRTLIHSCTDPYPWLTFGIDLLVGSGADSLVYLRQELFLPEGLMNVLDQTTVARNGQTQSIVLSKETIIDTGEEPVSASHFWTHPMTLGICLFILCIAFAYWMIRTKRYNQSLFYVIFLLAGLAGCLVAFMTFFSVHPCMFPNWNIIWLHPLHILTFCGCFFRKRKPLFRWYHRINALLLILLLAAWFLIPQSINIASIPFILCLLLGSGYWLYTDKLIRK